MADPFVAEIRIMGFNFAPTGWATCDGQLIPISQNTALFSLLGTTYGGDGKSTFALPNLDGSAALHPGQGQGLTERYPGEVGGRASVTLIETEIPAHNHALQASPQPGDTNTPTGNALARSTEAAVYGTAGAASQLSPIALTPAGGYQAHNNRSPYLTLLFCIAMQGVYPPRP